ncbi:aldo/keto reductase [Nostoc sp.]|uniref:aldo/keto reductase n=1 Tax=Nostoc sp. TaxID=1180 RepID=UPI002FF5C294
MIAAFDRAISIGGQAIANSVELSPTELKKLQDKRAKTKTERHQQRLAQLSRRYEIDVTPDLVEKSEIRIGQALRNGYCQKVFLMTKVDGRTKLAAAKQIDESLTRLQTDHVDLMQFHEVIRMEDPDRIFAPDGALSAMLAAQKAGKVRYIGFTGHKDPLVHLRMLDIAAQNNFHFDTLLMPLNVMDAHFRSFQHLVLPVALKEKIGVLSMKPMGGKFILKSNTVKPIECLHYAMNLPTSVVITGIDSIPILDQALEAVRTFQPMSQQQLTALLARTAQAAAQGQYELFKTTNHFDSTAKNPEWLG